MCISVTNLSGLIQKNCSFESFSKRKDEIHRCCHLAACIGAQQPLPYHPAVIPQFTTLSPVRSPKSLSISPSPFPHSLFYLFLSLSHTSTNDPNPTPKKQAASPLTASSPPDHSPPRTATPSPQPASPSRPKSPSCGAAARPNDPSKLQSTIYIGPVDIYARIKYCLIRIC